jgi:hypothetical protein
MGCSTFWRGPAGMRTGVRDEVRGFVIAHLGDPQAVLVADETDDFDKGTLTAGVQM